MRLIFNRRSEGATVWLWINFISRQSGQRAEGRWTAQRGLEIDEVSEITYKSSVTQ